MAVRYTDGQKDVKVAQALAHARTRTMAAGFAGAVVLLLTGAYIAGLLLNKQDPNLLPVLTTLLGTMLGLAAGRHNG